MRRNFWRYNAHLVAAYLGAFVLLTVAVSQCGCTNTLNTVKVAEYTASETVIAGYRALNLYDQVKLTGIRDRAHAGKVDEAATELAVYVPVRSKVFQALDDAALLLDTVDKAIGAVVAGVKNPADLLAYLPQLAQAALAVKTALTELGVAL